MVEIIIGVWLTCFCLSMIVVAINFNWTRKKLQSRKLKTLNSNLEKIGQFWSNSQGNFATLTAESIQADAKKTQRVNLLMAFLGLWSVIGFLLLLVVVASVHMLARSRKEIATFQSALAEDPTLARAQVEVLVRELGEIH